jgi:hypothetical protein
VNVPVVSEVSHRDVARLEWRRNTGVYARDAGWTWFSPDGGDKKRQGNRGEFIAVANGVTRVIIVCGINPLRTAFKLPMRSSRQAMT